MGTIEREQSPEPQSNADRFVAFIEEKYGDEGAVVIDISSQILADLRHAGISLDNIIFTPGRRIMVWFPLKEKGTGKKILELIQKTKEDARVLFGYVEGSEDMDSPTITRLTEESSTSRREYFDGNKNFPIIFWYEKDGQKEYLTFSGYKPYHLGKLFLIPE
jgi:hypothetical protein